MSDMMTVEQQLAREQALRRRLVDVAKQLSSTLNHDALIDTILQSAAELLDSETASLLLLDEASGDLEITHATGGIAEKVERQTVPKGKGIAGWVMANHATAIVNSPGSDERFFGGLDDATGFETSTMLAAPLRTADRTIGVLEIINKTPGFDEADAEIAEAFASLAAIALENAGTYARLADAVVNARMSYRM